MKTITKRLFYLGLLVLNFVVWSYFRGTWNPPTEKTKLSSRAKDSFFIPKSTHGINHLVLKGDAFSRGLQSGRLTKDLLYRQEEILVSELHRIFPYSWLRRLLEIGAIHWFHGTENYISQDHKEEMYGISFSAPTFANYLGSPYMRQVAYHAVHEIGQMMIDQGYGSFACTQAALKTEDSWIIGRNFDFEVHPIFDEDKVVKWIFPDNGYSYVSVIWAGMVGSVSGVNEHGIYIALNAAASDDFKRLGTPSTLVISQALQHSKSTEEALAILRDSQMFITDIFVVAGPQDSQIYIVEKSPEKTLIIPHTTSVAVSNHLQSSSWKNDKKNNHRIENFSTVQRYERAQQLLNRTKKFTPKTNKEQLDYVAQIMRDKKSRSDQELYPGNRGSIDALIASHSIIYDLAQQRLFVSQGPHLQGAYLGYDLKKSFQLEQPIQDKNISKEAISTPFLYQDIKKHEKQWLLEIQKTCGSSEEPKKGPYPHHLYYQTLGKWEECRGQHAKAQIAWKEALKLNPPIRQDRIFLEKKINDIIQK